jgi:hypothetical protein
MNEKTNTKNEHSNKFDERKTRKAELEEWLERNGVDSGSLSKLVDALPIAGNKQDWLAERASPITPEAPIRKFICINRLADDGTRAKYSSKDDDRKIKEFINRLFNMDLDSMNDKDTNRFRFTPDGDIDKFAKPMLAMIISIFLILHYHEMDCLLSDESVEISGIMEEMVNAIDAIGEKRGMKKGTFMKLVDETVGTQSKDQQNFDERHGYDWHNREKKIALAKSNACYICSVLKKAASILRYISDHKDMASGIPDEVFNSMVEIAENETFHALYGIESGFAPSVVPPSQVHTHGTPFDVCEIFK